MCSHDVRYIYMIVQHQFASSILVIAQAPFKSSLHAPYINQYRNCIVFHRVKTFSKSNSPSFFSLSIPVDGNWVAWTTWSACTVTCGGGTKDRERTCTNPAPQYLGKDCVGVPDDRTDCNTHHCPSMSLFYFCRLNEVLVA